MTSFPVQNPAAAAVLDSGKYKPVVTTTGAHFANVVAGQMEFMRAGGVGLLFGALVFDVTGAAAAGEQICELSMPPIESDAALALVGFGTTINAVAKGAAAGSGVVSLSGPDGSGKISVIIDAQAHVATGYIAYFTATLALIDETAP